MITKGQIVEIPADSPLYKTPQFSAPDKEQSLRREAFPKAYSLFDGFLVGGHSGLEDFRLGQRRGIGAGGKKEPLYVIGKDRAENRLFAGAGKKHPGLWMRVLYVAADRLKTDKNMNWPEDSSVSVKVLAGEIELKATLYTYGNDRFLEFETAVPIALSEEELTVSHESNELFKIQAII